MYVVNDRTGRRYEVKSIEGSEVKLIGMGGATFDEPLEKLERSGYRLVGSETALRAEPLGQTV